MCVCVCVCVCLYQIYLSKCTFFSRKDKLVRTARIPPPPPPAQCAHHRLYSLNRNSKYSLNRNSNARTPKTGNPPCGRGVCERTRAWCVSARVSAQAFP